MKTKLYKINYAFTDLQIVFPSDDQTCYEDNKYTERNGYYKSKAKARFVMFSRRLENVDPGSFREKKLKQKIKRILDDSPEVAI